MVMSIINAVAPPCRFPMRLQREGVTLREKTHVEVGPEGVGVSEAETRVRFVLRMSESKPWGMGGLVV